MSDEVIYAHTQVIFSLDTEKDLTGGVQPEIHFKKPSGTTGEWTGSISGQKVEYVTETTDLDETGKWELQPSVILGGKLVKGKIAVQTVYQPIKTD